MCQPHLGLTETGVESKPIDFLTFTRKPRSFFGPHFISLRILLQENSSTGNFTFTLFGDHLTASFEMDFPTKRLMQNVKFVG